MPNNNPTGVGGFVDNPQNINTSGSWEPKDSISFQYKRFMKMTVDELKKWIIETPESEQTVAQGLAYSSVLRAKGSRKDLKEVTDRTDGKPPQSIDLSTLGRPITAPLIISDIPARDAETQGKTTEDS